MSENSSNSAIAIVAIVVVAVLAGGAFLVSQGYLSSSGPSSAPASQSQGKGGSSDEGADTSLEIKAGDDGGGPDASLKFKDRD